MFSRLFLCRWSAIVFALCLSVGLQAADLRPPGLTNPAPDVAFSSYNHFEEKPIAMGAPYAGQEANEKARAKIQENLNLRVTRLITEWNGKADFSKPAKTLVLEPRIVEIKFINATVRVWARSFAGSSGVLLEIRFVDKESGKVIATPIFYQRANKHGGAWSFGATDNNMLVRITEVATNYIKVNYDKAVGGPTGAEEKKE